LYTGSGAVLRGYNVIVPVDAVSSLEPYTEQFGIRQLANGPTFGQKVILTEIDTIKF
jgi:nicotinamidase-related amidase